MTTSERSSATTSASLPVLLLDVAPLGYPDRLTASALQGLANRQQARLFLNFGVYDEPSARRTNEDFLPDAIWQAKFRPFVGNQDEHNLAYYRSIYDLEIRTVNSLEDAVGILLPELKGVVIWDPAMPDTVNIALMLSALEGLLVLAPEQLPHLQQGLPILHDLRGRWTERVSLYSWAYEQLFPRCKPGVAACVEPGWQRPEFADYLVQNRIFTYSLSSFAGGRLFKFGQTLLLLLVGGPFLLRNLLFDLHLDGAIKRLGLWLMGRASPETRLATRIQRSILSKPYPTLFGWHTRRDDELAFMLLLSANDTRLVPCHLADNFSFHSMLPARVPFTQEHLSPADVALEKKVYLTFTLSDGDQLVLMGTAELGNWRRPERGKVPFNWETQPLLVDLAPALLGQYYQQRTPADYLIAGPSGAGYIIPPLNGKFKQYLDQTAQVCQRANIRMVTPYIGDPPLRLVRQYGDAPGDFLGYIAGYAHFGRTPLHRRGKRAFVAYTSPFVKNIWDDSDRLLEDLRRQIDAPGPLPRFVSAHLFAYKTTITDVFNFVATLDPERVKVVKADEFVIAAEKFLRKEKD